jgi:hypothetical protein
MTATGSVPSIDDHAAVGRGAVEVQQHRLRFRLDDGHRDVVPGECADHLGRLPERVRGQLGGAVLAKVAAQQAGAVEPRQSAQLGQQRAVEVAAVVPGARCSAVADQVLTIMPLVCAMTGIVACLM